MNAPISDHPEWVLFEAVGLSDTGYIVGSGFRDRKQAVFLLIPKPSCGASATNDFTITRGGLRYNNTTKRFIQSVAVMRNSGSQTISEPVAFVLGGLSPNVTLFNLGGNTACALPADRPFVALDGGSTWVPGQTRTVVLEFANSGNGGIAYTPEVLVGAER